MIDKIIIDMDDKSNKNEQISSFGNLFTLHNVLMTVRNGKDNCCVWFLWLFQCNKILSFILPSENAWK